MAELSRISDHFLCQGFFGLDLGAFTAFLWAFVERERLYDFFEYVTGTRLTTSYTRIGGLAMDLPSGYEKKILEACNNAEKGIEEIENLLNKNKIFLDRIVGIGKISKEDAINYSFTGPMLRSCGVEYDIRRAKPYSSYEDFDFKVITNEYCDCYGRFQIRTGEIRESIKIIRQALSKMPKGPVNYGNQKITMPDKNATYSDMESLIHHFKILMLGQTHGEVHNLKGEYYSCTEAPNGELGFHIIADGGSYPYRVRVRPPSLMHFQGFPYIIKGHNLSDFVAVLGSMNIIAGELDR